MHSGIKTTFLLRLVAGIIFVLPVYGQQDSDWVNGSNISESINETSPIGLVDMPSGTAEDFEDDTLVDSKFLDKQKDQNRDFFITGKATIIDGDTISINKTKIRFSGIDAPESSYYGQTQYCRRSNGKIWACGKKASSKLKKLINGQEVQCTDEGKDRYGRTLSICYANGMDLQAEMVRSGMAVAYLRYSDRYENEMVEAMNAQVGIWGGPFVEPEQWRIQNRKK